MGSRSLQPGDVSVTPARAIGAREIDAFAELVGDFTPIHVDEEFAKSSPWGVRIAHGPLAMSTAIGLFTRMGMLGERVIGLVNLNWDFAAPVKLGDAIHARVTVESVRATSKPGRSLAIFAFEVVNQDEILVERGRLTVLVRSEQS
jgi:acyl dehydratase